MKIFKDPLLHFLVVGGLLFFAYAMMQEKEPRPEINITRGKIESLSEQFAKVWQRPPSERDLQGVVEDFVHDEVLYREALALGLDQDDTIIRRRLRQKLEFLSQDLSRLREPTEEELRAFFQINSAKFRSEARYSFHQVYLSKETRGAAIEADANGLLEELRAGKDPASAGDQLMLPRYFSDESEGEVLQTLGRSFGDALRASPVGRWSGPVESGYGLHLVRIEERVEGRLPKLDEVRAEVVREWQFEQRQVDDEAFYQNLRKRYVVNIESSGEDAPQ